MRAAIRNVALLALAMTLFSYGCSQTLPIRPRFADRLAGLRMDGRNVAEILRTRVPPAKKDEAKELQDLVGSYDELVSRYDEVISFVIEEIKSGDPSLPAFSNRLNPLLARAEEARGTLNGCYDRAFPKLFPSKPTASMGMVGEIEELKDGNARSITSIIDAVMDGFATASEALKTAWIDQLDAQRLPKYSQLEFVFNHP